ncbi:MAG: hypothetical protein JW920_07720 [Deltaproteobacteria bacterium]|nr:hypothetical protein [Deltaproteobacteria bacterium]
MDKEIMLDFNYELDDFEDGVPKNPLLAWKKINECWKAEKSLPKWVMRYLGRSSEKILELNPPTGKAGVMIKNALGFNDARCFSTFEDRYRHSFSFMMVVYDRVREEMETRTRGQKGSIFYDIGKDMIGSGDHSATVEKLYKKAQQAVKAASEVQREIDSLYDENNNLIAAKK